MEKSENVHNGLPLRIDWSAELPEDISVPRVDIHSLVLDFSAVSFLDISAMKGLKMAIKEFQRIQVDVYIVSCDVYILEKLHACMFFDDDIVTSMFFPSLHDAVLHVLDRHQEDNEDGGGEDRRKDRTIKFTQL